MEGRGPARDLRRSVPGGHGAVRRGAAVRADRLRARPQSHVLAARQARRRRAAGAALPQQRRDRARAGRQRGRLGVPLLPRHREGVGGQGSRPSSILVPRHRPAPSFSTSTRARSRSTTAASARRSAWPWTGRGSRRRRCNGYAPPADATGLAESQKRWKDATLAQDPWTRRNVAEANRLLDAAGLARGADGIRAAGAKRDALHLPRRAGLDGLDGGGGDHPSEPGRGRRRGDGEGARLQRLGRCAATRALRHEPGLRQPRPDAVRVLPRPDGWRARAADRARGRS